nr:hypothetical protein [Tanacetum cinerariifolium]
MSTNEQTPLSQPTSAVRNTLGREQAPQSLVRPVPDEDLREYSKARLNFEEASQKKEPQGKVGTQGCPNQIHKLGTEVRPFQIAKGEGSGEKDGVQKIEQSSRREAESCYQSSRSRETEIASEKHRYKKECSQRTEAESESEGSAGGHWKSKPKKQKSSMEDDLSQPWANRRNAKGWITLTFDQGVKAKQRERSGKDSKKGETSRKDKPLAILMVQSWKRIARQRISQIFSSGLVIYFPTLREEDGTEGPMIIEAEMGGHCVHRIYVDGGSSSEILNNMASGADIVASKDRRRGTLNIRSDEFHGGEITLSIQRDYRKAGVRKIRAISSTAHGMIKFPVASEIVTLQSSKIIPLECSMVSEPEVSWPSINQVKEEKIQVAIHAQKKRGQAPERNKAISEEVRKLVEDGIMKEVHYHSWLSKPVMVKKHNDSWRMCVDFKDLNKDKAFQKQIGRNLEVYVDDLVIKIRMEEEVIRDAEETFKTLRKINMKLNPKKCAFGMREGTFLGYKVDADGMRVSPNKVKALIDLPSLECLKDVQKLNGKLASLNRFLSKRRSIQRNETINSETSHVDGAKGKRGADHIFGGCERGHQCNINDRERWEANAIYFVSRALQGPEVNYTPMEKLILALVSASKRLKRYFQAHTIVVITDQPIKQLLSNPEVTGRLLKWRFELGEHDIQYRPRTSVKGQILADFIMERPKDGTPDTPMEDREELLDPWILFTDGSSCVDGSGAEYEALIAGLWIASQMGVQNIQANVDSKLVANQVNEVYIAKEPSMVRYLEKVKNLASTLKGFSIKQIPRWENKKANGLKGILLEERKKARTIRRKAGRYAVISEMLYKKYFLGPWLRCVGPLQANYVLREIHEGSCSMHAGPRSVVAKALRTRQGKISIVAVDYFTKWIEAKPVASITGTQVKKFVWDNIVCRFGLPREVEEVSHVLWAHRTMIKSSNGQTPFSLTYGTEAVIPAEIGMPSLRTAEVDVAKNNEAMGISLDLVKEKREQATIQEARSKTKMEGYYNARVRSTSFRSRDLVYQNNEASHAEDEGKLGPKWEGPYEVTEALGKGPFKLKDRNGHTLPRTWNIRNLRKCYIHEM